jgi:recombination protein U
VAKDRTQAKRGMSFEARIGVTNQHYKYKRVATIQKIPTPTKNIRGKIVYSEKSTVDFMGSMGGVAIAFEAKETSTTTNFPLVKRYKGRDIETILLHQREFLRSWDGIGFVLIHFKELETCYAVDVDFIESHYAEMYKGGRKSIPIADFKDEWIVDPEDYLAILTK